MGRIVWDDNFYLRNGKSTFAEFEFSYAEVIKGLNEFYSGETKNTLCEGYFRVFSEAHDTEYILLIDKWLNKAIEWLRVKHEIFYHPGMEARYAKTDDMYETLEERWRNRRAWDALEYLYKTVCKDGKETVPTLMGAEIHDVLCEENQKSDVNKLISDYCAKNDIAPPSPYFSDKACLEYLFSVVDLERRHREAVGKQMVDNYEKDLLRVVYKKLEELLKDVKEE